MHRIVVHNLIFIVLTLIARPVNSQESSEPIVRVLFGSCVKQELPTPIFQTMMAVPADLAIFLGDNIYADTEDMSLMRAKYDQLAANRDFNRLRRSMPILAVWDDHDYGVNDGGADFPMRKQAQTEFLRFWDEPEGSPRRSRDGVYDATISGPKDKRLQVILLDTRYFRSPLKKGKRRIGGPYLPDEDPSKTMLGDKQWNWLSEELRKPAEVRVIATSIQCVASASGQETWSNLPLERQRLFNLIADAKANGVVLISGDRHWAELSLIQDDVPYPIHDMTSSSFNQIHSRGTPTENVFRADETTYHRENYGVISLDWDSDEPAMTMEIRDMEGGVRITKTIELSQLQP